MFLDGQEVSHHTCPIYLVMITEEMRVGRKKWYHYEQKYVVFESILYSSTFGMFIALFWTTLYQ
jgi:hypothetical protein